MNQESYKKDTLEILLDESANLSINQIKRLLNKMNSAELAHSLESSPPKQRKLLWSLIDDKDEGDVLADLGDEIQQELLLDISNEELSEIVSDLELDEIVDILQQLPENRMKMILGKMSSRDRTRIELALNYPEDSAGGLLNTDVISVRPNHSIEVVMNYLRAQDELPKNTDKIFVVSAEDLYLGELSITKLLTSDINLTVKEVMDTDITPINDNQDDKEVSTLFERNDLISSAVVDRCLVYNNQSNSGEGGGIRVASNNGNSSALIRNSTIAHNSPEGIRVHGNATNVQVSNSIIYGNDISITNLGNIIVSDSNIEGGFDGSGNFDENPQFCNINIGDYQLAENSSSLGDSLSVGAYNYPGCEIAYLNHALSFDGVDDYVEIISDNYKILGNFT